MDSLLSLISWTYTKEGLRVFDISILLKPCFINFKIKTQITSAQSLDFGQHFFFFFKLLCPKSPDIRGSQVPNVKNVITFLFNLAFFYTCKIITKVKSRELECIGLYKSEDSERVALKSPFTSYNLSIAFPLSPLFPSSLARWSPRWNWVNLSASHFIGSETERE